MRRLVELTFDYQEAHPEFVRLVNTENVNNGRYIEQSEAIRSLNVSIIDVLASILQRGREQGLFRSGLDPVDVHMLISAFCFFRVSNQYTFGIVFQRDLSSPKFRQRHRTMISEVVLGWLTQKNSKGQSVTAPAGLVEAAAKRQPMIRQSGLYLRSEQRTSALRPQTKAFEDARDNRRTRAGQLRGLVAAWAMLDTGTSSALVGSDGTGSTVGTVRPQNVTIW